MQIDEDNDKRRFKMGVCLGRGGFGEVYRARMSSAGGLETDVAVKVLRNNVDPSNQGVQRLRDEGRLLARIDHPAILRVVDLVVLEGCPCLVTELVDGADLCGCWVGDDAMPVRAQLEVIAAIAGALHAAWNTPGPDGHPLELVHRDIKPANIRISRHGQAKLLDFGIARTDKVQREARTQTGMITGTLNYMAPERFSGDISASGDVFALGCCLYEGLSGGRRLFADLEPAAMFGLANDQGRYDRWLKERLAKLPDAVSKDVRRLLCEVISREPEGRPTAAELVRRCEVLSDAAPGEPLARWARDHDWREAPDEGGPFGGRVLTEGTLARPGPTTSQQAVLPPAEPSWSKATLIAAVLGLIVLIGGGLALVVIATGGLVAGGLLAGGGSAPPVAPIAALPEAPPVSVKPSVAIEVAPVTLPPEPTPIVHEAPPTVPKAKPQPAVVPPIVAPVKAADPAPAQGVAVGFKASGYATGELVSGGSRHALPGDVSPGEYHLWVAFGEEASQDIGMLVRVEAGSAPTISCNARLRRCTVN